MVVFKVSVYSGSMKQLWPVVLPHAVSETHKTGNSISVTGYNLYNDIIDMMGASSVNVLNLLNRY